MQHKKQNKCHPIFCFFFLNFFQETEIFAILGVKFSVHIT